MTVLITGGAGYIGSHIAVELLNRDYDVLILDNLSNSSEIVIDRIKEITKKDLKFVKADVQDKNKLREIFANNNINSVIHLAGYKAVGESVEKPLEYYDNNLNGAIILCEIMKEFNIKNFIFSSSATVYGSQNPVPFEESMPKGECTNPYAWTKWMIEQILTDIYKSDNSWNITILRYFNPVGAHKSGLIGEDPAGIPNNLSPYITQVAIGKRDHLTVFGDDYNTHDGTGVRDYIHVVDLAIGHVAALQKMQGLKLYNLGTGKGSSVLDMVNSFEKVIGKKIPYEISGRRAGDIDEMYCDITKAKEELGWSPIYNLDDMCEDSWNWQENNPEGY